MHAKNLEKPTAKRLQLITVAMLHMSSSIMATSSYKLSIMPMSENCVQFIKLAIYMYICTYLKQKTLKCQYYNSFVNNIQEITLYRSV